MVDSWENIIVLLLAMIAFFVHLKVKTEKLTDLRNFFLDDCKVCEEQEPGTLRFDLWPDPANKNAFYLYEAYRDLAAFDEHTNNKPYLK